MQTASNRQSSLLNAINRLAEKILRLCDRVEALPGKRPELLALLIYGAAHLVMAVFHEPWYDEAVAWQIARCASVRDILLEIPHYEGHPPLWHLILLPFAKLGAPYELSLSLVSLVFAGSAVGLILWRSPFPRIVRLLLPFTYFFFYQYGVISRPYCVMMLAFVLLAMSYGTRNEKPGRYTLCLMLLCLTSAYGIVIAGGLAMVWVWEIWNRQNIGKFFRTFPQDKRIWWLAALLMLALLLIAEIMPREDTFATNLIIDEDEKNSFLIRLIYTLLACIPDTMLTSVYCDYTVLASADIVTISLFFCSYVGILVLSVILYVGKRKCTVGIFFVPFFVFSVFSALAYMSPHHIGIVFMLIVFWLWVSWEKQVTDRPKDDFIIKNRMILKNIVVLFCSLSLLISLVWSAGSSVLDICLDYAPGRNVSKFIKEHSLDDYRIMVGWQVMENSTAEINMNTWYCSYADNIAPYFSHNILYNFMDGDDTRNFTSHKVPTKQDNDQNLQKWKEQPYPDVLFMEPEINMIWDYQELSYLDYTMIYCEAAGRIWKLIPEQMFVTLHIKNDLIDELGLQPVQYPVFS